MAEIFAGTSCHSSEVEVDQGAARSIDRRMRMKPLTPMSEGNGVTATRTSAMTEAGVRTIANGPGVVPPGVVHRLDKADTIDGPRSVQPIADLGAPYPVLLYKRFLNRPYPTHRDSVSELVGEVVEVAVKAKVSCRETKRAERIPGFDQAPDFIIPDEFTPVALIEAKLTEDEGMARGKVTRVQRHTAGMSSARSMMSLPALRDAASRSGARICAGSFRRRRGRCLPSQRCIC